MKAIYFTLVILLSPGMLLAQDRYIGIFDSEELGNPEIHADGIYQFFVEADNLLRRGFPEKALLKLDAAIGQHPYFVESYLKRARILQRLGRYTEAREDLENAYRMNPAAASFFHQGNKREKLQWIEFSPREYRHFIEQHPDESLAKLLERSIEKKLEGDLLGALLDVESVIGRSAEPQADLYSLRGNIFLMMEDYQKAVDNYDRAIQLAPNEANYYFNRALAKLFTYDRSAACIDLEASNRLGHTPSLEKLKYFCYY